MKKYTIILILVLALAVTSLVSAEGPSDDITDTTPTFVWSKVAGATIYHLQLMEGTTVVYNKYPNASACGISTCSSTPTTILNYSTYKWRVRAKVNDAWGSWSSYTTFTVIPVPTPKTPSDNITDRTPKYTWSEVTGAVYYQIQLMKGTEIVYNKFTSDSSCAGAICSKTPTEKLDYATYSWRVRAKLDNIWKPWSSYKTFTVRSEPVPTGNWISSIACQNLDSTNPVEISLIFYAGSTGSVVLTYDDIIPAGGSKNYVTTDPDLNLPADFMGSAVVSSSRPVACNANTKTTGSGSTNNPYRLSSSSGVSETIKASSMVVPQVMKTFSGWNSYVVVQNTGNKYAKVEITYRNRAGNPIDSAKEIVNIAAYSSKIVYQKANLDLPNNFIGSAKVTAINPTNAEIAVVVNFYNTGKTPGTSQFHSYNGFSAGASKLYVPRVVRQFYGYNSGMAIQNIGTKDTSVTITFNFNGKTYIHHTGTIKAQAATPLYLPDISVLDPVASMVINRRFGSAILEVDEPGALIVAIVNEDNRGNPKDNNGKPIPIERVGQGSSYSAIAAGTESKSLYFQQVMSKVDGVISGGFQISNVTNSSGKCNITFYGAPKANLVDYPIEANGSLSMYAPNIPNMPDGFNAGVTAVCTVKVIGIANAAAEPGSGKVGDSFMQNNAINK